jgi:hypothetical protein
MGWQVEAVGVWGVFGVTSEIREIINVTLLQGDSKVKTW